MGNELKTIVSADTSKFVNEFQRIGSAAKRVTADMKKFRETTDGTFTTAEKEEIAFARSLGQLTTQSSNAKGQLKELRSAVENLTISYRSLTDEEKNSPFGQAIAQSIQELTERAGNAKDAIVDIHAAINNASSDTRTFDQIAGGMNTLISTVQVGVGALQAFGIKNKGVIEAMSRLQGIMAVTNGITTIQNNLQRQSALMQGIMAVQIRARAVAEAMATKGTKAATVAQTVFNAVANANPYVLLTTAIIAVGTALVGFAINAEKAAEEEKKLQIQSEKNKKVFEQQRHESDTLGQRTGDLTAKYLVLQAEWKNLKTIGDKVQWIKDNQSSFNQLGLSINNVNDAYDYFVKNASKVIDALTAIAEADAYKDLYAESIKKREKEWNRRNKSVATGDYYRTVSTETKKDDLSNEEQPLLSTFDYKMGVDNKGNRVLKLDKSGVDKINKYRQEQARKTNKELKKEYDDEANYFLDKMIETSNKATQLQYEANIDPYKSGGMSSHGGSRGNTDKENNPITKELKKVDLTHVGISWETLFPSETAKMEADKVWGNFRKELMRIMEKQPLNGKVEMIDTSDMKPLEFEPRKIPGRVKMGQQFQNAFNPDGVEGVEGTFETIGNSIGFAADQLGRVSQAMQQLGEGNKTLQTSVLIAQTLASLSLSFAQAMTMESKTGVWGWIAAGIAGTAQLISMAAQLKSINAGGYAKGGIIPGNSYYGDRLVASVNSGEMILNKRQQSNLFSMINSGNALGGGKVEFEIRADRLIGVQKNYNRKQSKF